MSQFRIKGIDYPDESLEHGLGKGSGRGRPVGSKNGQVMPGAAYMKGYKVVGEKAVGEPVNASQAKARTNRTTTTTSRSNGSSSRLNAYGGATRRGNGRGASGSVVSTTPRAATNNVKGVGTQTQNMAKVAGQNIENDWPWSARRVNAAGGLASREGRQIIYDNPTLDTDYKKHIAKFYGDSDGKSYPKENNGPSARILDVKYGDAEEEKTPAASVDKGKNAMNQLLGIDPKEIAKKPVDTSKQPSTPAVDTTPKGTAVTGGQPRGAAQIAQNNVLDAPQASSSEPADQKTNDTQPQEQGGSLWDRIGGWFNQAGKDIGDAVVSGLGAAGGAISDAAAWAGDRLKDAGEWAVTSTGDVGKWVGDRAKDLNNWWNGYDYYEQVADPNNPGASRDVQAHQTGARENIGNFLGTVGKGIGDAAGDVGRTIGNATGAVGDFVGNTAKNVGRNLSNWWDGENYYEQVADPNNPGVYRDVQAHRPGFAENVGNFFNNAGQWIGNTAGDVGRTVDEALNGRERTIRKPGPNGSTTVETVRDGGIIPWVSNLGQTAAKGASDAVGAAGQAASDAAGAVGQGLGNAWDTVSNGVQSAANTVSTGAQNLWNNNIVTPVTNAANAVSQGAQNAIDGVRNWWDGTDNPDSFGTLLRTPVFDPNLFENGIDLNRSVINPELVENFNNWVSGGHTPGARENIGNGLQNLWNNNIVTPVTNAANTISSGAQNLWNSASQGAQNAINGVRNWWDGTDRTFLGIPVGHNPGARENIANGLQNAVDTVTSGAQNAVNTIGQGAQNVLTTAGKAGSAANALNSGVPANMIAQLAGQLANGSIDSADFDTHLQRLVNTYGRVN